MQAARSFVPQGAVTVAGADTILAAGFVLLIAFYSGRLFAGLGLPKLTGYIAAGVVFGPSAIELLSEQMLTDLRLVNGVAVCLIALSAGIETDLRALRSLLKAIAWISALAVLGTIALLTLTLFLLKDYLSFFHGLDVLQAVSVAGVLAVTIAAQSPAVVVALREELRADGPLIRTILGVVVIADLLVIVCFALMSSVAQMSLGGGPGVQATVQKMLWEIFGSIGAGLVVALAFFTYLRKVRQNEAMFLLAVCIVVAEIGQRIELDPLIVALTAGVTLKNTTGLGERLVSSIEVTTTPVFVLFFAVAGATIHLDVLASVGPIALLLVVVRAAGFFGGNAVASRIANAPSVVVKYAAFGLLPQAGLALALALLFSQTFPSLGQSAAGLVLGVVAINELIAPVLLRTVLLRSGEGKNITETVPQSAAS
ncbi:MAG: cation:proton antiporter [Myxococcales bacterium]|nr:MAG: cation:proton antiporter [Myxococcales bacterium]